jgi:pyruvate dehydrogenase E2 component (dihydrolipoamide acetyltransferase)
MPTPVIMPKAGMAMESGVIHRWHKRPGDPVGKGDLLLEIETDKVTMEVESEASGVLLATLYPEGATVAVIETIAWIGAPGEAVPVAAAAAGVTAPAPVTSEFGVRSSAFGVRVTPSFVPAPQAVALPASSTTPTAAAAETAAAARPPHPEGRPPATPAAKRLAREREIDLCCVAGSGPNGEIRLRDIEAIAARRVSPLARKLAAQKGVALDTLSGSGSAGKIMAADVEQAAAERPRRVPLTGMRRLIAQRMTQSRAEIPDATLKLSADVTDLFAYRAQLKQQGLAITVNDLLLRATAIALGEFPFLNATFEGGEILCWPDVNLGVAVSVENGLVVPVLRRVQQTPLAALAALARDTFEKARAGKLLPDAFLKGTFTVTNLGMLGIEHFTPLINPPQTAILGVCAAEERPARGEDGQIVWRKAMGLCLTHDHRVIDGALGAAFLNRIKELLENPSKLV